jgi:hypothetical protein
LLRMRGFSSCHQPISISLILSKRPVGARVEGRTIRLTP